MSHPFHQKISALNKVFYPKRLVLLIFIFFGCALQKVRSHSHRSRPSQYHYQQQKQHCLGFVSFSNSFKSNNFVPYHQFECSADLNPYFCKQTQMESSVKQHDWGGFVRRSTRKRTPINFFSSKIDPDSIDESSESPTKRPRAKNTKRNTPKSKKSKEEIVTSPATPNTKKPKLMKLNPITPVSVPVQRKKSQSKTIADPVTSSSILFDEELQKTTPPILVTPVSTTKSQSKLAPKSSTSPSPSPSPSKKKATKSGSANVSIRSSDLAKIAPENPWIDLRVSPDELRPSTTLTTGQSFSWMTVQNDDESSQSSSSAWGTHDATEWLGPFGPYHVLSIRETPTTTFYRVLHDGSHSGNTPCPSGTEEPLETQLKHYFQLNVPLSPLYEQWSEQDTSHRLGRIAKAIKGVRVLQQDPIECLFSFICSSNNNIPRITLILSRFRKIYGNFLLEIPTCYEVSMNEDDVEHMARPDPIQIFSFPTLSSMKSATESDLREMGLGYRAKYIVQTRDLLIERGGLPYLLSLRCTKTYTHEDVQTELIGFSGIGRKVADCVALFSLDREDAIPVDVHVWHIACRDYNLEQNLNVKSLTPTVYKMVGDLFRGMFREKAGWAHSLLFVAELPSFRAALPKDMVKQMDEVSSFKFITFHFFTKYCIFGRSNQLCRLF